MAIALHLATQSRLVTPPNPSVGCVITNAQGQVLGQGSTQPTGGPHAEIMALRDAAAQGHSVAGATAHVTLEPCSHHGRTGPCCDALVAAGIHKVVASLADPNPMVSGQGFARLRAAGVEVETGPGAQCLSDLAPFEPVRIARSTASRLARRGIALPFCERYGAAEVEQVVAALRRAIAGPEGEPRG